MRKTTDLGIRLAAMTHVLRAAVPPGVARAGGLSPVALLFAVFDPTGTHDGYHLTADHHDLIAYGRELTLVAALIFVGAKLVGARRLRWTGSPLIAAGRW